MTTQNTRKHREGLENAQSLLRVLKNFFQIRVNKAIRKVNVEQIYKQCNINTNYTIKGTK